MYCDTHGGLDTRACTTSICKGEYMSDHPLFCPSPRLQAPPPSVHTGISVHEAQEALSRQQKQGTQVEGAPPAYSEVIGHYYHPASLTPDLSQSHGLRTVPSAASAPVDADTRRTPAPAPSPAGSAHSRKCGQ